MLRHSPLEQSLFPPLSLFLFSFFPFFFCFATLARKGRTLNWKATTPLINYAPQQQILKNERVGIFINGSHNFICPLDDVRCMRDADVLYLFAGLIGIMPQV